MFTLCLGYWKSVFRGLFRLILRKKRAYCAECSPVVVLTWTYFFILRWYCFQRYIQKLVIIYDVIHIFWNIHDVWRDKSSFFRLLQCNRFLLIYDSSLIYFHLQRDRSFFSQLRHVQLPRFCRAKHSIFLGSRAHLRWMTNSASRSSDMNIWVASAGYCLLPSSLS